MMLDQISGMKRPIGLPATTVVPQSKKRGFCFSARHLRRRGTSMCPGGAREDPFHASGSVALADGKLARASWALFGVLLILTGCATAPPAKTAAPTSAALNVPVEYYKLANGLRVVLSEDHSVPIASIGVYYNIGF